MEENKTVVEVAPEVEATQAVEETKVEEEKVEE